MDKQWQLQQAKSHLSEVIKRAEKGETQVITKRGERVAVLIDYARYLSLTGQEKNLLEVLRGDGPYLEDLLLERDADYGRELDLG